MNPGRILKSTLKHWIASVAERLFLKRLHQRVYLIMGGHIYFQTLSTAVQLDLFTLLGRQGPMTRAQLASALNIDDKPARILLLGCATLGLIRKNRKGQYSNSRLAAELLNQDKPRHIVNIIKWQHFINYRAMFHFADAVKANRNVGLESISGQGATLYERLAQHPELERIFQDAMQGISVQANRLLAEAVDFSRFTRMIDVGGGNATNIINLARQYPSLKAVVFDAPSVCAIAEANILNSGLKDRLGTVPGDCFKDAFPQGVDCILFAHFMTIWGESRNKELLRKAYDALPSGGVTIIFNMMQDDSETGPLSAALGSPYFLTLATGEGMLYTWSEYERWMKDAGFKTVVRRKLIRDHGIIMGIK